MASEEHLQIIRQGVKVWNEWRKKNPELKPDLSVADLRRANLTAANLGLADNLGEPQRGEPPVGEPQGGEVHLGGPQWGETLHGGPL